MSERGVRLNTTSANTAGHSRARIMRYTRAVPIAGGEAPGSPDQQQQQASRPANAVTAPKGTASAVARVQVHQCARCVQHRA